jgi:hypothetical protein
MGPKGARGSLASKKCRFFEGSRKSRGVVGHLEYCAVKEAKILIATSFVFNWLQRPSREFFAGVWNGGDE